MHRLLRKPENKNLLFTLPALFFFTVFIIVPVINSFNLSFTNWDGISDQFEYIGLKNFQIMFEDRRFFNALKNTLIIGFGFAIIVNVVSLLAAILVDKVVIGKGFFRSAFYLPVLISGVISGFIWSIMFNRSFGILNHIIHLIGFESVTVDFIGKMPNAMLGIIFVLVWQRTGYYMVIYLAGLQGVPSELIESAHIDGGLSTKVCKLGFPIPVFV